MKDSLEYQPLTSEVDEGDGEVSYSEKRQRKQTPLQRARVHLFYVVTMLLVSALAVWQYARVSLELSRLENAHSMLKDQYNENLAHVHEERTPYAELVFNSEAPVNLATEFMDVANEPAMYQAWKEFSLDSGVVALSDEYAESYGIPLGTRFPWDESKGVYVLNTFHILHCVKSLQTTIHEYHNGLPQTKSFKHTYHCLDAIRREAMCQSDDTPWSTGDPLPSSKYAKQSRRCRNFEDLSQWGRKHSACFSYDAAENSSLSRLEHFRYCPEGSPYTAIMTETFLDMA